MSIDKKNKERYFGWGMHKTLTKIFIVLILIAFSQSSFSQTYEIDTYDGQTVTTCSGNFYDSGGSSGNYSNSEDYTVTFYSGGSDQIEINFNSSITIHWSDHLYVYDGPNTSGYLIENVSNLSNGTRTFTSHTSYITFRFVSDGMWRRSGWEGTISCISRPLNDEPCDAIDLTVGTSCSSNTYTNIGASFTSNPNDPDACLGYNSWDENISRDVWFKFTVPASQKAIVDVQPIGTMSDGVMAVYEGANCSSLSIIDCDDDGHGGGGMPQLSLSGRTPGETLWIRIWDWENSGPGTFGICVYDPPVPDNDFPCDATQLAVESTCNSVSGTNAGASNSGIDDPGCGTYNGNDVWYYFIAPASQNVTVQVSEGTLSNAEMAIYTGSCTTLSSSDESDCDASAMPLSITDNTYTEGDTVWVRVWGDDGIMGTFDICVYGSACSPITVDAGTDSDICDGDNILLGGSPTASGVTAPFSYAWTPITGLDDETIANPTATPTDTTTYTVIVTDNNGCQGSDQVTINVNPNPTPSISGNTTVCPGATGEVYSTTNNVGSTYLWEVTNGTINGSVTNASVTIDWDNTCNTSGTVKITETISATSCATTTADYSVTIKDDTNPTFTGSITDTDVEGCTIADAPAAVNTVLALEALTGDLDVSDNCSADADMTVSSSDVVAGTCPIVITRTYTVTDECGNTVDIDHIIRIDDNTNPTFTGSITDTDVEGCTIADAPAAVNTVLALEALTGDLDVSDNCSADADMTVSSSDAVAGTCPIVITRTYTVTDECGNTVDIDHIIRIDDNTNPTFTGSITDTDVEGCTIADAPAAVNTVLALEALTGDLDVSDNCSADADMTVSSSDAVAGTCPIVITRTYTVTDECGNTVDIDHIIRIDDNTNPTFTGSITDTDVEGCTIADAPAAVNTVLALEALTGDLDVSDNCSADADMTVSSSDAVAGTCPIVITRTYTVTDECGNTVDIDHIIRIDDNTNPTFTGSITDTDVEGCTIADAPAAVNTVLALEALTGDLDVSDNCSADADMTVSSSDAVAGTCPIVITRTYTVTDECGNTVDIDHIIRIDDNTNPTFTGSITDTDVEGCTIADAPAAVNTVLALEALTGDLDVSDNCSADADMTVSSSDAVAGTCPIVITRTYTVTDECGNTVDIDHIIRIDDNTNPTFTGSITDTDVEGCTIADAPAAVNTVLALEALTGDLDVSDNCSADADMTVSSSDAVAGTCPIVITRTYTVTDECGNTVDIDHIIRIDDNTNPTFTGSITDTDVEGCTIADAPAAVNTVLALEALTGDLDVSDNCSADADMTVSSSDAVAGTCPIVITRTYTVTDECGNTVDIDHIIRIDDNTNPTFTGSITDTDVEGCTIADAPAAVNTVLALEALTGDLDVSDNCSADADMTVSSSDAVAGTCPIVITRTYTVTDECGNTVDIDHIIRIDDNTNPTFTGSITDTDVEGCTIADAPAAVNTVLALEALTGDLDVSDNCSADADMTVSSSDAVAGTCPIVITRTYTVTDECGNTVDIDHIIRIDDNTNPTFTGSITDTDVEGCTIADAPAAVNTVLALEALTGDLDVSDNCSADADMTVSSSDAVAGTCPIVITRTYTVTDECGNTVDIDHIIRIDDNTNPTFTGSITDTDVEGCTIADAPAAVNTVLALEALTGDLDVSDNCSADADMTVSSSDAVAGTCPIVITRTYTVTDECGNTVDIDHIIRIDDNTNPTFTGSITDTDVEGCTIADAPAAVNTVLALEALTGDLDVSDNCSADADMTVSSSDAVAGTCPIVITRTYTVTDECGNTVDIDHIIRIDDNTNPTFTGSITDTDVEGCTIADAPAAVNTVLALEALTGDLDVSDNCSADADMTVSSSDAVAGTCPIVITRTYTVTDECGNTMDIDHIIRIDDNTNPTFTGSITDTDVEGCTIADAPAAVNTVLALEALTGDLDVSDNCSADADMTVSSSDAVAGTCPIVITRTYTVTDECGNTVDIDHIIRIDDNTNPTFTGSITDTDVEGCTIADAPAAVNTVLALEALTGDLDVSDNCSADADMTVSSSDAVAGTCPIVITRTYTVTDECGNTVDIDHIIRIDDNTNPTFTGSITDTDVEGCTIADAPAAVNTVLALEALTGDLDVSDNCSADADMTVSSSDAVAGTCPIVITRTYTVTDECGNTVDIDHIIRIDDNTNPTFTAPSDITVCTAINCSVDYTIGVTGDVLDETDNCSVGLDASYSDDLSNLGDCDNFGFIARTWSLTDDCGNTTEKIQYIYIEPLPKVILVPQTDTLCNNETTNISISSITEPEFPVRFKYVVEADYPDSVNVINGIQTGLLETDLITDLIQNLSSEAQRVLFIVTPYSADGFGIERCSGINDTTIIWVEPTPVISAPADTICDLGTTNIDISSNQTPTREVYYTYSSAPDNVGAVTGNTSDAVGIPITTNIQDVLDNTTDTKQRVVYTITPHVLRSDGSIGCAATPITVDIWVEPTPVISAPADTICDLGTTDIDISSNQTPTREVYYTYSSAPDNVGAVTGNTSDAVGIPITTNIQDVLDNTTDTKQRVVYTITPHVLRSDGSIGCAATPITVDVWVEPTPVISAPADTICDLGTTDIDISSNQTPTREVYYTYSSAPDNVGAVTGNTSDAVGIPITTNIQDVLDNTTDTKQRVVYTITPHVLRSDGSIGCAATPITVDIWVEPTPVISAPADTICDLGTTDIDISSNQTPTREVYYTYSSAPDNVGAVTGNTSDAVGIPITTNIQDVLDNTTDTKQRVVYTITPHVLRSDGSIGCAATPITVDIWVEPTPVITAPADTICDLGTTNIDISSNQTPTREVYYTYSSAPDNVGAVTGNTSDAVGIPITTNIQDVLDNTTDTKQRVVYTITPHVLRSDGSIGCAATPITVDIWVEPTPVVTAPADTICDLGTTDIDISSNQTPTREVYYTYSSAPDNVGAVTGNTSDAVGIPITTNIQDVLDNTTDTKQRVVYTITPHVLRSDGSIGCAATPITVDIWVEPTPVISAPADTICDLGTTNIDISSNQTPTREVYYTYSSAPDNVGAVTGNTSDAVGIPITTNIQDVLDNTTDTKQRVVYTITPHVLRSDGSIGCAATPITVDIWVEPTPVITAPADTICDLGTTNIDISSNQTPTREVYYTYSSAPDNVGAVTGNTSDAVGIPITTNIQDVLDNTTDTKQRVVYTITPHVLRSDGSIGCAATPITVDIWVEPTPVISAPADTICDLGTTDIDISSNQTPTREVYYTYSSAPDNVGAVTGNTSDAVGIPITTNIQDVLDNTTDTKQRVVYTITPHVLRSDGSIGCAATPITVDVWVEPTPVISAPADTICDLGTTDIDISSNQTPTREVYYTYSSAPDNVGAVTGNTSDAVGIPITTNIQDVLDNTTDTKQRVVYTITPHVLRSDGSIGCAATPITVDIWVEPTPVISAPADTICDLGTTDIDISSNQTPTREVYYTYSSAPDNVGAVTGNTSDAVGIPITTNIQDVLDNTTDTKQRVVYTITPHVLRSDGSIGCAATPITVDIWVEPTPVITAPADTICDLGTTNIDISSNQTPTREVYYTYSSAPDNVGAVTGNTSDAVGIPITTNIQDVLDNTTDTKQRVVYTITPHVLRSDGSIGCAATPITVDIWVEPTPVITAPADTICDLGTTDIDISSNQTPTREVYYTYSSAPDNVGAVTGNTSDAVGIPITTNIQDVLDNTTDTKQRVVYTITPHVLRSDGSIGCAATPITVDIWVEPTPVITAPADTICDLGTTDIDISSNQTPTREVYYTYSSAPDNVGAVTGNTSDAVGIPITTNIQDVLDNTTDTKQRVVYTITPHVLRSDGSIGCAATPITVDIWVEPTPVITAPADTICDLGTTNIDISSNQTPTREVYYTYSSAPDNVGAVTGNTSDAVGIPITTNIQDVLDNTTDTKQRVVYTITPHVLRSDGSIGCAATPITVDIWVEPTPVITAPADTICDLGTTDIDISSNQTPTREVYYTYSSAPDNVGAVTGNTSDAVGIPITTNIQDVLDNTTDTKQRVVYTITPHVLRSDGSIGCAATPITVDIWVEPTPVITAPADTICDLGTTDIDISSNQTPTREVYYTYSSAPDNVGAVTGNTSDAVGIPITTNIQDVLDNTTDTKQRVVYTITPHVLRSDGSIGCAATPITVDIWVEPTPVITAPADTICDLGTTNIDISSNQTPTREVYYTYSSAPDNVGAVTGNTSDAVGIPITTNIQDVLDNTTDTKQRVVYTITPHVLRSDGSIGCAATPITVDIWVEPTPVITAPADTICDLGTTDIDISSNQTPTREVYYTYSSAPDNVGAVTGNTSDAVGIPITTNIQDVLDNTTDTKQRVVYTITPHVLRSDGSIGCAATPITVDIWVEPTPVITAPADTICDLGTTNIDISSNQTPTREVYYTYSSAPDNVGAVTGNTSDAVGIPITTNIQDVLDNTTDTKQRVVYTITPHVLRSDGSIGCAATPITVDIWVEPTPVITAPADTICDLGTTDIDISSNQTPTREVYYTYSSAPDNVGAVTGNTSDAVGIPITTNIQDVLDNTTDTKQRVVYTITPHVLRSDGSIGCAATPITVDIWVEPTPVITAPADTICDLGTTNIDISSNQTPTREVYYTYSSAPDNVGAVTGNTSDAVGIPITTNIQDVLDNTTDTKQRVVYTITPHVLRSDGSIGCAATPITVDIWVEPTPVITAPADTICDLGTTNIDISSNQTPTREVYYTYSSAPDNVGAVTGNTSDAVGIPITTNIQDVLDNTTDTKQRVVYTITPHVLRSDGSIGCAATPITVDIWVEPTPVISAPADTICDLGTTDIDISSNQTPTREVYYTYSSAPDNVGAVTGNTSDAVGIPITTNIQDVLDNTTDTKQRVVYTITPHVLRSDGSIGCAATPITVDIWVEPTPVISAPADTICDLGTTNIDISSNQTPTREVYYTYSSAPDNVGAVTGNTSDAVGIPITTNIQDVLDNTTDTKQRVVYTITPHVLRSDGSIGCAATPITVDIWVEPTPVVTAPADTICDLGTTDIDISSNQTPTREVYYTYSSAPDNVGAVTGNTSDAVGIPITTNIQDVLDNTTDTKQRVVYTITPHVLRSDGSIGCAATPITVDIWVEPTPVISAPADTICDLGTTNIDISSNQTPTREVYYTYSSAPDNVGAVTGNTSDAVGIPITTNIQDVLDNTTDTKQRVVYTITPHVLRSDGSIGCAATPITVDIWVEPTPVITAPADTICDLGTTDIDISSNQTPTREVYYTYSSAPDNVGAVTGNTSDAVGIPITTNIQDVLDNTTDTKQRVVYTITPHVLRSDGSIGCAATPITVDIWVNPEPLIEVAVNDTLCFEEGTTFNISTLTPSGNTTGTWVYDVVTTISDPSVSGNTDRTDETALSFTDNLVNNSNTLQWVDYEFTAKILDPRSGLAYCSDGMVDTTIRIYINPEPLIEVAVNDTLCFEEGTTFNISTLTPSANTTGTWVYDVVTTISDPSVSGNTDRTDETALSFTDNLVNNSNTLQWVDYEFTAKILDPRSGLAYCSDGTVDTTIRIYINPEPLIEVAVNDTLCFEEGTTFNISTLTPSANTTGTWVYDVVTTISDPSVSGNTDRTDETALSFTDNLVNNSNTLQWVDYEFTAKILDPRSGLAYCSDGMVDTTIRIYINPEPLIEVAVNDTLCFEEGTTFNISTLTPSANTTGTWVYDVVTTISDPSVSGNTDRTDETALSFTDNLVNNSNTLQWVDYEFTAKILDPRSGLAYCSDGTVDTTIRIYINPEPLIEVAVNDTLCFEEGTTFNISTLTPSANTTGTWVYDVVTTISDPSVSGNTDRTDETALSFTDNLVNTSNTLQWVDYEFTAKILDPRSGLAYCSNGTVDTTIRIYINPEPLIEVAVNDTLCFEEGTTFNISTLTPSANTTGTWVYDVVTTISDPSVSGNTDRTDETALSFTDNLVNNSNTLQWVDYEFTAKILDPRSGLAYCSDGMVDTTIRIYINPEPLIEVAVNDTLCFEEGTTFNISTLTPSGNTTGTWVYDVVTTISDPSVSGNTDRTDETALSFTDNLVNNSNTLQWVDYEFTAKILDPRSGLTYCSDGSVDTTIRIYINPEPLIELAVNDTLCFEEGTTFNISTLTPSANTTGTWVYDVVTTISDPSVSGNTDRTDETALSFTDNLVNTSNTLQWVDYEFTAKILDPRSGLAYCSDGTVDTTIRIYINPEPLIEVAVNDTLCFEEGTSFNISTLTPSANTTGTWVYDVVTTISDPSVSGNTDRTDETALSFTDNLVNTSNTLQWVDYEFTAKILDPRSGLAYCSDGTVDTTIRIYINPEPLIQSFANNDTLCYDEDAVFNISTITPSANTTGTWVYDVNTIVSNASVSGNTDRTDETTLTFTDNLINSSDVVQWVDYQFTAKILNPNTSLPYCTDGIIDTTIRITLNPLPRVIITVLDDSICNDTYTHITLTTPTLLTDGLVKFDYSSLADIGLTGHSTGLTDLNNNYLIEDSLHNISTAPMPTPLEVVYSVTPSAGLTGCANGPTMTETITVHPTAYTQTIADSVVCYLDTNGRATVLAENGINDFIYNWNDPSNHQTAVTDSVLSIGWYKVTVTDNQGCIKEDSILIEQPDRIIPVIDTVKNVSCFGAGDGYIVLNPLGGNSGYTYNWSNGKSTDSIYGLDGALYYATVTDWKGCAQDTVAYVEEPPQISIDVFPHHVRCYGENNGWAEVDAVGVDTYIWSTGETTAIISNLSPGPYSVTATNAEGCKSIQAVEILEPDSLVIENIIHTDISCAGDADGTFDLQIVGGNTAVDYTYNWWTPDGTGLIVDQEDQSGLSGGKYYVTVTDWRLCEANDSAYINEPPLYYANLTSSDITCNGDHDGSIDLMVNGGNTESPYTYSWTTYNGSGLIEDQEDQDGLEAGTYYVTVYDAKNCELKDTAIIVEPDLLESFLTETNSTCYGYNDGLIVLDILGGTGNYTIEWSNGATEDSIYGLGAGTYYVTVTDEHHCSIDNYVEITEPDQIQNNLISENITCYGYHNGQIKITPEGGTIPYSYLWSHSGIFADSIANNLGPGTYTISVVDNNNCIEVSEVDITEPDELSLTVTKEDITCFGMNDGYISLSMFGGTPDYTYNWSNGITDPSADMLSEGYYSINIQDIHNCLIDTNIFIEEPEKLIITPEIRRPTCPDIQDGYIELNIAGGRLPYTIYWDDGTHEDNLYDIRSGIFDVLINDSSLCEIDTSFIVRSAHDFCIDIPTAFSPNNDNINDKWVIEMDGLYPHAEIEVFDRWGKRVFYSKGYDESKYWDGTYNGKDLPMDAYYYIIYLKNGSNRISGTITIIR